MKFRPYLMLLPALLLAACDNDNNDSNDIQFKDAAVIATRAPDYSSGAVSLVDTATPFTASNGHAATISDIFVRSGGDHYFVVHRFNADQVVRFNADAPDTPVYTYSTLAPEDTETSNPSDLIIASDSKAYLLRYGSGKLWIVNPSAATEAAFKIGEIDLSAYDTDGVPDMQTGLIKDGKLYVVLQRLEAYNAVKSGYLAVIDVATNAEIDTRPGEEGLKGIELPVQNPGSIVAIPGANQLLLSASGNIGNFPDYYAAYTGGLVTIDTSTQTASLLRDDGTVPTHPYGVFIDAVAVSATRAYFLSTTTTASNGVQTLYRFNPSDNAVAPVVVAGLQGKEIGSLALDPEGKLWVSRTDTVAPGVTVLGFSGTAETVVANRINTNLTPINIDFVTVPTE